MQCLGVATRWRCCSSPQRRRQCAAAGLSLLWAPLQLGDRWWSVVALKSAQTSDALPAEELHSVLTDVTATLTDCPLRQPLVSPQRWSNNQVRSFFILQTLKPAAATWEITFCFFARIRSQVHIARMLLERRAEDPARHHMMSGLLFTWTTLMVIPSRRRTVVVFLVEWRETWRFLHTLMKVCWSFCWHVNLVLLVSRFAQKLLHNNYQDLISIPCVFVLPANGCSHSLVHSNTII